MDRLKLFWKSPRVEFRGRGISEAWRDEVLQLPFFELTDSSADADLIFFASESQLDKDLIGDTPTVCYFWGWPPELVLQAILGTGSDQSEWMRHQLTLMQQCTVVLVPSYQTYYQACDLGIASTILAPGADTAMLDRRRSEPVTVQRNQVLFISRLAQHKGLDLLIGAISMVRGDVKLVVCGPGDRSEYQKMAAALNVSVEWLEPTDDEKAQIIRESAVLVHPSTYEGFGLPPLEALYLETPVICSDLPWARTLLQENAFYFSRPEHLANLIADIVSDPRSATHRTLQGAKMVRTYLNLEAAAGRLYQVLHEAIRNFCGQEMRQHPERVEEIYDRDHRRNWAFKARNFDPGWERHWRAQHFLKELKLAGALKILDVGCGPVYPTIFGGAGFEVTAFDISAECLVQVRSVAEEHAVSHLVITDQGRAEELPYPDDVYDAVILGEILEHVLEPPIVLSEAMRVVKPGGVVLATTPVGRHHFDPLHIASEEGGWSRETIGKLIKQYSTQVVSVDTIAEEGTDPSCFLLVLKK